VREEKLEDWDKLPMEMDGKFPYVSSLGPLYRESEFQQKAVE